MLLLLYMMMALASLTASSPAPAPVPATDCAACADDQCEVVDEVRVHSLCVGELCIDGVQQAPSDGNPCTHDEYLFEEGAEEPTLFHVEIPGCCTCDADCNDGDECTIDTCEGLSDGQGQNDVSRPYCQNTRRENCCTTVDDCPSDPCKTYTCELPILSPVNRKKKRSIEQDQGNEGEGEEKNDHYMQCVPSDVANCCEKSEDCQAECPDHHKCFCDKGCKCVEIPVPQIDCTQDSDCYNKCPMPNSENTRNLGSNCFHFYGDCREPKCFEGVCKGVVNLWRDYDGDGAECKDDCDDFNQEVTKAIWCAKDQDEDGFAECEAVVSYLCADNCPTNTTKVEPWQLRPADQDCSSTQNGWGDWLTNAEALALIAGDESSSSSSSISSSDIEDQEADEEEGAEDEGAEQMGSGALAKRRKRTEPAMDEDSDSNSWSISYSLSYSFSYSAEFLNGTKQLPSLKVCKKCDECDDNAAGQVKLVCTYEHNVIVDGGSGFGSGVEEVGCTECEEVCARHPHRPPHPDPVMEAKRWSVPLLSNDQLCAEATNVTLAEEFLVDGMTPGTFDECKLAAESANNVLTKTICCLDSDGDQCFAPDSMNPLLPLCQELSACTEFQNCEDLGDGWVQQVGVQEIPDDLCIDCNDDDADAQQEIYCLEDTDGFGGPDCGGLCFTFCAANCTVVEGFSDGRDQLGETKVIPSLEYCQVLNGTEPAPAPAPEPAPTPAPTPIGLKKRRVSREEEEEEEMSQPAPTPAPLDETLLASFTSGCDCCANLADVFDGQTKCFTEPFDSTQCGGREGFTGFAGLDGMSFDYNCNGKYDQNCCHDTLGANNDPDDFENYFDLNDTLAYTCLAAPLDDNGDNTCANCGIPTTNQNDERICDNQNAEGFGGWNCESAHPNDPSNRKRFNGRDRCPSICPPNSPTEIYSVIVEQGDNNLVDQITNQTNIQPGCCFDKTTGCTPAINTCKPIDVCCMVCQN